MLKIAVVIGDKQRKIYSIPKTESLLALKTMVKSDTHMPLDDIVIAKRDEKLQTLPLIGDQKKLVDDFGVKNMDLLYLISEKALHVEAKEKYFDVVEDLIDKELQKDDGWITVNEKNEPILNINDYIAPWNMRNIEKWKDVKNLPFHAWMRNPANKTKIFVESYKTPNTGEHNWSSLTKVVKMQRQDYRHVDSVLFEDSLIAEKFIAAWRASGIQQYGFLYGSYVKDVNHPLGVQCVVSVIYTPSRWNSPPAEELTRANQLADALGLMQVGWIFTALGQRRKSNNPLIVKELWHMANNQNLHPNKCASSNTGHFGSKFVSIVVLDDGEGRPHLKGFQMSNDFCQMIQEEIIKVSRKDANSFVVLKSKRNSKFLYPEILFFDTTEDPITKEKNLVEKRADSYLYEDIFAYFIVTFEVTSPVLPRPSFRLQFPAVYHKVKQFGEWSDVKAKLDEAYKNPETFFQACKDFHFLLWLSHELVVLGQTELYQQLLNGALSNGVESESHNVYRNLSAIVTPRVKKPQLKNKVIEKPKENTEETKSQLLMMGYDESLIDKVKLHGNNMGEAINYILDNAGSAVCDISSCNYHIIDVEFSPRDYYSQPAFVEDSEKVPNSVPVKPEIKPKSTQISSPKSQIDPTIKGELLLMGYDENVIDKAFNQGRVVTLQDALSFILDGTSSDTDSYPDYNPHDFVAKKPIDSLRNKPEYKKFFGFDRRVGGGDAISSEIIPGYNPKDFEAKFELDTKSFRFKEDVTVEIPGYNPKDFEDIVVPVVSSNTGFQFGNFIEKVENEDIPGYNPQDFEDGSTYRDDDGWTVL